MAEEPQVKKTATARWPIALVIAALVLVFNATVAVPVGVALGADKRNERITIVAYRSWGLSPTGITVDLLGVGDEAAPVDIFRGLFQAAASLKDRHFERVTLARGGVPIFHLEGDDFQELGAAYADDENPMFLIRTLPQKLRQMDGSAAFEEHYGGWLYVLGAQLEDVNVFAQRWLESE